ncbi:hypothetical protein AAG906_008946 [Vitis piasezkii]
MCGGDDHLAWKHPVSVFVGGFTVTDLDSPLWIRVGGRLTRVSDRSDQRSDQRDMDSQIVTEAIANLGQRIDGQQTQQVPVQEIVTWEDFDGAPVASLSAKFRMPEIERYTGIGCPRIHLRLYSTEFLRQFAFNTVIDVSRRELEALRQRPEKSATSFISIGGMITTKSAILEKISQIIDRPLEKDQINMIMRSLQPRFGIARGLWPESSPTDSKGKKPSGGQRSGDVGAISSVGMRPPRHYRTVGQTSGFYYPPSPHVQYRPPAPSRPMTPTYLHPVSQPVFAAHVTERPPAPYTRPRAPQTTTYVQRPSRQFAQLGMPLSRAFQKLMEGGLLTPLAPKPVPQPVPPRFRLDLHCSYHQGPGHDTDHCNALRHAIQDLIDQGLVNLGQPSVTTNPLPAHSTHAVPPSSGDIHHIDLIEDDSIHMLSWDDGLPEPIVLHDSYDIDGESGFIGFSIPTLLSLIPDEAPFQLTHPTPLIIGCRDTFVPFTLWRRMMIREGGDLIVTRSGRIAQPPPLPVRPFEDATSHEEIRREDDEVLRQLQNTQARISIWSLLASSSHLHHVFDDDLPPRVRPRRPLYITVGCSAVKSHIRYSPWFCTFRFWSFYSIEHMIVPREVMGTLVMDLQIGPAVFSTLFRVLRILHPLTKVKFIHDGQVITRSSTRYRVRARLSHTPFDYPIRPYRMSLVDYFVRGSEIRPRVEEVHSVVHTDREIELQHLFHQLQLSDGAPGTSVSMATPTSPDRASMLSLCFPKEITNDGVIVDPTEMIDGVVPHDEYRDEMDRMTVSQIIGIV